MRSMMTDAALKASGDWAASGRLSHAFQSAEGPYCDICTGEQDGIQHPLDPSIIATEKFLVQRTILASGNPPSSYWHTLDEAAGKVGAERRMAVRRKRFPASVKWRIVRATTTYTVVVQDEEA